ncbi:MAG: aldo/keto reductase [Firmicutes bacterium]|nr:aldo/keto reductase [Bacillota bacterium]
MKVKQNYQLQNGISIPSIGFGTWQIPNGEMAYNATLEALKIGYRHIDTAAAYQNEESVGKAIKDSGLKREEVFITSKLRADMKGYQVALDEFDKTINKLGVDYLDLYLIHAPKPWGKEGDGIEYNNLNVETWKAFIKLYQEGKIRAIGVSNFRPEHLIPLVEETRFAPHINQIYLCPGALQTETVLYAKNYDILIEAYSPFATGRLFKVEQIHEIAKKYNRSAAQLAIRWSLQHGFLPLPKSVTPARIESNFDVFDFEISEEDMMIIDHLEIPR